MGDLFYLCGHEVERLDSTEAKVGSVAISVVRVGFDTNMAINP